MIGNTPAASRFYFDIEDIWRNAGARPQDWLETVLEMLAVCRRANLKIGTSPEFEHGELTLRSWESLRENIERDLNLPHSDGQLTHLFDSRPGLLEHTRRTVAAVCRQMSAAGFRDFARSLLNIVVHAPGDTRQTSLGYYPWPDYLGRLSIALLGRPSDEAIYCPFASSGWMPVLLADAGWTVHCELPKTQAARIQLLFADLCGGKLEAHVSDPIRDPSCLDGNRLRRFKRTAAITSFGLRLRDEQYGDRYDRFPVRFHYGEAMQLAHLIAQTDGRLLVIVPEGFLFRTAGGERDYKERLIRRGMLSCVVRLPKNAFAPSANIQSSLLIFDTTGTDQKNVLFVDASEDLDRKFHQRRKDGDTNSAVEQIAFIVRSRRITTNSMIASYDDIAVHDFNISVDRYVRSENEQKIATVLEDAKTVELNDLAEIIRPQALPADDGEQTHIFAEVSVQDVQGDGSIDEPTKLVKIEDRNLAKVMRQKLEPDDVLLSVRGRIGTVGIVPTIRDEVGAAEWLASQAFVILRLRNNSPITPLILYRYLASPLGQGLLNSLTTGATVPMISMGDLKKLRIMVPTLREQREIEQQYEKIRKLRSQIKQLEQLTDELKAASWPMTKIAVNTD